MADLEFYANAFCFATGEGYHAGMGFFSKFIFIVALLGLCWLGMMLVHELGHCVGAVLTGGTIQRVVVHPLTLSRTDVSPSPNPSIVVWLGPIVGCVLPLITSWLAPTRLPPIKQSARFFAGFCLLANGVYIGLGAFDQIGDCGDLIKLGWPTGLLLLFGAVAIPAGLLTWHRLGSVKEFLADPASVDPKVAYWFLGALVILVTAECIFSAY